MPLGLLQRFLKLESASGILLFLMAILAVLWSNSSLAWLYHQFIAQSLFIVNEGLMAIFFLMVGLELKRGFFSPQKSENEFLNISLPLIAALGGMIIPALIYIVINYTSPETLKGWATPCATDIAFALGVLTLFGKRVPSELKLFLLALAIFDDLGAILIIGFFYTTHLSPIWLFAAAVSLNVLILINIATIRFLPFYLIVGGVLWFCLFKSGVHPTIAGVLLALTIPQDTNKEHSPLLRLEEALHPWVAFLIMPLFALANAGFSVEGMKLAIFTDVIVLGIVMGLFFGKQIGVFGAVWLSVKFKWAKLPKDCTWLMIYGLSLLCGIGFTMSLFLGTLSFQDDNLYLVPVRLGVIMGSLLSGSVGAAILWAALPKHRSNRVD